MPTGQLWNRLPTNHQHVPDRFCSHLSGEKESLKAFTTIRKVFRRWLLRSLQPCEKMVPLMSQSMERTLELREWLPLRVHLLVCAWCRRYLKQIRFIRRLLREERPAHETDISRVPLDDEARHRIGKSMLEKQRPNAAE